MVGWLRRSFSSVPQSWATPGRDVNASSVRNGPGAQQQLPSCATRCGHRFLEERGHCRARCAKRLQPCRGSRLGAKQRRLAVEGACTGGPGPSREAPPQKRLHVADGKPSRRTSRVHSAADIAQSQRGRDAASRRARYPRETPIRKTANPRDRRTRGSRRPQGDARRELYGPSSGNRTNPSGSKDWNPSAGVNQSRVRTQAG